jgi:hypothetical protein
MGQLVYGLKLKADAAKRVVLDKIAVKAAAKVPELVFLLFRAVLVKRDKLLSVLHELDFGKSSANSVSIFPMETLTESGGAILRRQKRPL